MKTCIPIISEDTAMGNWQDRTDYSRGSRRYEDDRGERRGERNWSERAGDEARSWFGDEDIEHRRTADENYRSGGAQGHFGGGYGGRYESAGRMSSSTEHDPYADYDRSRWHRGGGTDRDMYGYPRRQSDDWRSSDYGGRGDYRTDYRYGSTYDNDRGFLERAGDEVASWFGDDDAARRRDMDARHRGRGPKNYTRSDERISEDVNDRLSDDRHIDASNIEVSVSGGEVTLNGTVTERFAKRHAEDLAEGVSGVKHVQNNLRVSAQQSSNDYSTKDTSTGSLSSSSSTGLSETARH
jgi:osmotically-inducible protein OsmY